MGSGEAFVRSLYFRYLLLVEHVQALSLLQVCTRNLYQMLQILTHVRMFT